jgi:formylglycine-generating enzyme required for sulfatase activity
VSKDPIPVPSNIVFDSLAIKEAFADERLNVRRRLPGTNVYEADDELSRTYAVKAIDSAADPDALTRIRREASAAIAVEDCRHVVRIHRIAIRGTVALLLMEWIKGETVARRLSRGKFTVRATLRVARPVAMALSACHDVSVVHRDLKPSNVMIEHHPVYGEVVRVIDFGIVGFQRRDLTKTGTWIGTPRHMSPEQGDGDAVVTAASDIYQLGLLIFEMLTGSPYCKATTEKEQLEFHRSQNSENIDLGPDCPEALAKLVKSMLRLEPSERPLTSEVLNDLEMIEGDLSDKTSTSSPAAVSDVNLRPLPTGASAVENPAVKQPPSAGPRRWRFGIALSITVGTLCALGAISWAISRGIDAHRRSLARSLLLKGRTKAVPEAGGRVRLGRNDAEKEELLRQVADKPTAYVALVKADLKVQNERTAYLPPFEIEENEVTWQQFSNWLTTLPTIAIISENEGELDDRYVVDPALINWQPAEGQRLNPLPGLLLDNYRADDAACWVVREANGKWTPKQGCELRPVERMSKIAAERYCEAIGRQLMSADEYEYVAGGGAQHWNFPWGNEWPDCSKGVVDEQPAEDGHKDHVPGLRPECPKSVAKSESVRDHYGDKTADNVFGLFGNVAELTSTTLESPSKKGLFYDVVKGASYRSTFAEGTSSFVSVLRDVARDGTGFRCVARNLH